MSATSSAAGDGVVEPRGVGGGGGGNQTNIIGGAKAERESPSLHDPQEYFMRVVQDGGGKIASLPPGITSVIASCSLASIEEQ